MNAIRAARLRWGAFSPPQDIGRLHGGSTHFHPHKKNFPNKINLFIFVPNRSETNQFKVQSLKLQVPPVGSDNHQLKNGS